MHFLHLLHLRQMLQFSHLAVLTAALLQWMFGAIWYSLIFVKPWDAATGQGAGQLKGKRPRGADFAVAASFLVNLVFSFLLLHMILWRGATSPRAGAFVGFVCWLGFIAGPLLVQTLYEQRPKKLLLIHLGYWLVAALGSGGLLAIWQTGSLPAFLLR
jgi:hypothetical protein